MVLRYHYAREASPTSDIEIIQIRLGELALAEEAGIGSTSSGAVWVDDPDASQDFEDWRTLYVDEDAAPDADTLTGTVTKAAGSTAIVGSGTAFTTELVVGREIVVPGGGGSDYLPVESITDDTHLTVSYPATYSASGQTATVAAQQRVWTGYIGDQEISDGEDRPAGGEPMGNGRDWSLGVVELNAALHLRLMTSDADRPAETVDARMAWLLATDEVDGVFFDDGFVASSSVMLDAVNLRGRYVDEILNTFAQSTGYDLGLYWHEARGRRALWFQPPRTVVNSSPLMLTNDPDDIPTDGPGDGYVYPMWSGARLKRSGRRRITGVYVSRSGGSVYRTSAANLAALGVARDGNAPAAQLKTDAAANAYGDRYLEDNAYPDLQLTCKVTVPAALVNSVRKFQRIQVKNGRLPGLASYTWCRVLRRAVSQHLSATGVAVPGEYDLALTLDVPVPPVASSAQLQAPQSSEYAPNTTFRVDWDHDGDAPRAGCSASPLAGLMEYVGAAGERTGLRMLGYGPVSIACSGSVGGSDLSGPTAMTAYVYRNGVMVASESYSDPGPALAWTWDINLTLGVNKGDLIECWFATEDPNIFVIPGGVGSCDLMLLVTGNLAPA